VPIIIWNARTISASLRSGQGSLQRGDRASGGVKGFLNDAALGGLRESIPPFVRSSKHKIK
jgi:hypothetical protein